MSTPELLALAMRAPIPTLAERARRARHILARMGVVVVLFGCSAAPKTTDSALDRARQLCEAAADLESLLPAEVRAATTHLCDEVQRVMLAPKGDAGA